LLNSSDQRHAASATGCDGGAPKDDLSLRVRPCNRQLLRCATSRPC